MTQIPGNAPDEVPGEVPGEVSESGEWLRTNPLSVVARGLVQLRGMVIPFIAILVGGAQIMENSLVVVPIFGLIIAAALISAGYSWYVTRYRIGSSVARRARCRSSAFRTSASSRS